MTRHEAGPINSVRANNAPSGLAPQPHPLAEEEMINTDELQEEILSPCCNLSAAPVDTYSDEGTSIIRGFLSDAKTVLVLRHHIHASLEWVWFLFTAERGGSTCDADLHAKSMIEAIARRLVSIGQKSVILPYPSECGISFKRLGAHNSMGKLGDSFLFLYHAGGPWVHLRVLLTDVLIANGKRETKEVCTHYGKCIEACPGKALSVGNYDQHACGRCQQELRNHLMIKAEYRFKGDACARPYAVGKVPQRIVVRDKVSANESLHRIAGKSGSR